MKHLQALRREQTRPREAQRRQEQPQRPALAALDGSAPIARRGGEKKHVRHSRPTAIGGGAFKIFKIVLPQFAPFSSTRPYYNFLPPLPPIFFPPFSSRPLLPLCFCSFLSTSNAGSCSLTSNSCIKCHDDYLRRRFCSVLRFGACPRPPTTCCARWHPTLRAAPQRHWPARVPRPKHVVNVSLANGSTTLRGYNAWTRTQLVIDGPTLSSLAPEPLRDVTASWDIEGAYQDVSSGLFHGIMHREHGWLTNSSDWSTYKYYGYVTYARSDDDGLWFDPSPNTGNVNDSIIIISEGPINFGGSSNTGTGPQWAVARGGFLYLYVQDAFARDPSTDTPGMAYVRPWVRAAAGLALGTSSTGVRGLSLE